MFQLPKKIPLSFHSLSENWQTVFSPNDGKEIASVQYANSLDITNLLKSNASSQEKIKKLKAFERAKILSAVASAIGDESENFAFLISSEGGKPLKDARIEVQRAQETFKLCAEVCLNHHGEVIPMERTPASLNHLSFTLKEPIGPVLAISAFNHPLNLIAHQIGCALAAGNAVVLKPAPSTPICADILEKLFLKAGLPEGGLRVVHAQIKEVQQLASSDEFDFVSFIGSSQVGWELRKKIAPGTRLALEHGGVAAAIVTSDADLELASSALVKGAFYHAGQVCISTQVIFAHHSVVEKFLELFKTKTSLLKTGDARNESTDVGPLIRASEVERLKDWIDEALHQGAKLVYGNEVSGNLGQYLNPTILCEVSKQSKIYREEAFGPVVCINSYTNEEELVQELNLKKYIFESSIFTQNLKKAFDLSVTLSSMTVVVNNHTAFRVDHMPFGGHKLSGLGMGGVPYAIDEMTKIKQIVIKP